MTSSAPDKAPDKAPDFGPVALLRINGAESTLPLEEITIARLLAEARAVGLEQFAVFCDGEEVASPDDLRVRAGAVYVITPPEEKLARELEETLDSLEPPIGAGAHDL